MTGPAPSIRVGLRYGAGWINLQLPRRAAILQGHPQPAIPPAAAADAVARAIARPIGSPPLAEIVKRKRPGTVAITISDITRPAPNEPVVGALLQCLNAAGVRDSQVLVVIATGMHRPSTPEERRTLLGEALLRRVEVIDHVADDPRTLVRISHAPPVSINARFASADLKIVTGLIEPHFMAGFSGGRKGVCPGLVDLETVQRFHGHRTMADPHSVEGRLEGNPCHAEALRVARLAGVDFLVNVTITDDRQLCGVYAGDLEAAHAAGCRDAAQAVTATVSQPYDLVITSAGGYPLDETFYQTVKGMVMALPALHEHSTLLVLSACREVGSSDYASLMNRYRGDWRTFLADIAQQPRTGRDQWQFQMHARVLQRIGEKNLHLGGDSLGDPHQQNLCVQRLDGEATQRCQQFIDDYLAAHPNATVAAIPHGPYTMLRQSRAIAAAD